MATPTYTETECYTPNKPNRHGYVDKRVWNKELKKYQQWKHHRWTYLQYYGELPKGMEIDHMCHNEAVARGKCKGGVTCPHRACLNPLHLRAVTKSENQKSGLAGFGNRTHCESRGHELTPENIYTYNRKGKKSYECLQCRRIAGRENMRKYRAAKKEKQVI